MLPTLRFDPFSFVIGFLVASFFWLFVNQARPLLTQMRESMKEKREAKAMRGTSNLEVHHRQNVLHQAQGMHLAAPLFALDELVIEPRLIAPPPTVEPGGPLVVDDQIGLTIPYTPARPEFATLYQTSSLTIPEALSGGSHLVITGQAGIGKTVALAHLASLLANKDAQVDALDEAIPFLVHIADISLPLKNPEDTLKSIIDLASEKASVFDTPRMPNFIKGTFQSGRAILLVDGLDELSPAELTESVAFLKQLLKAYPKTRVVATGCPNHLDGLINLGFAPLALMAWNTLQSERFLEKWGNLWERYVSVEAWAQTGPEQIDPLLLNTWLGVNNTNLTPLEFTLKAWGVYAGDGRGATALDAIETHLRRLSPPDIPIAALEMLAMQVTLQTQPVFDSRTARGWIKSFEPPEEVASESDIDGEDILAEKKEKIAPTLGLLAKMAQSGLLANHRDNQMRFSHPIFFGFLAGRAFSSYPADEELAKQSSWSGRTLSMRYFAAKGNASTLANMLLAQKDPVLERNLLLTAGWLRNSSRKAPWRGKVMTALATTLQDDTLPLGLRGEIVASFAMSGDAGVAALFRQLLSSNSAYLTQLAALGSGLLHDKKAVEALTNTFESVQNTYTWSAACLALVAIGTNSAFEAIATALLQGDENLRRSAAESLANDSHEGWATLREGIEMDDLLVRRSVAYGLARLEHAWAIELLEKVQVEDEEWVVRNIAAELLKKKQLPNQRIPRPISPPSETPWLIAFAGEQGTGIAPGTPATDVLLLALKSEDTDMRLAALPYLRHTPTEGVINGLYHAMQGGTIEVREACFQTLADIGASGVSLPNPQAFGLG